MGKKRNLAKKFSMQARKVPAFKVKITKPK
jgi:hypothetical protein